MVRNRDRNVVSSLVPDNEGTTTTIRRHRSTIATARLRNETTTSGSEGAPRQGVTTLVRLDDPTQSGGIVVLWERPESSHMATNEQGGGQWRDAKPRIRKVPRIGREVVVMVRTTNIIRSEIRVAILLGGIIWDGQRGTTIE